MEIVLTTPRPPADNAGNETTSARWRRALEELGHGVDITYDFAPDEGLPDLLVALHASKSHDSIERYVEADPERPLVVALTGTDLYKYRDDHPEVDTNLERADAIVVLQEHALRELNDDLRSRTYVVHQSLGLTEDLDALEGSGLLSDGGFDVCFAAHLRDVKDPLRTAEAARELPETSAVQVTHVGRALSETWRERVAREDRENDRYRWHGEVPRPEALSAIADADLLTATSVLEGGPNVVSEAVALGTPVVASEIPGHIGLLGGDYPGYYPARNTEALAELLERAEGDESFYASLVEACRERAPRFEPEREIEAWRDVLETACYS